jgi:hypothetical protein
MDGMEQHTGVGEVGEVLDKGRFRRTANIEAVAAAQDQGKGEVSSPRGET